MANNGRRKSLFPELNNVPSDATFDFVSNGANYKIPLADFLTALTATGTIVQDGDPASTPVLDTQGTVNNIRNLKDGAGIKAAVNPNNGITLDHNFTIDSIGAPIMSGAADISPVLKSIVAGSGIAVSQVDDTIVIADSGVVASTKTVLINQKSDFPSPVIGVITLEADTNYLLANDINVGTDRFVLQDRTSIQGTGVLNITITYTGTGALITWVNAEVQLDNFRISAANGSAWDGTNVSGVIRMDNLSIDACDKIGILTSSGLTSIRVSAVSCIQATTDGLSFSGSFNAFNQNTALMSVDAGSIYDLGTATFEFFTIETIVANVAAGAIGIKGLVDSGNITATGVGRILSSSNLGAGDPALNIDSTDVRWLFAHNGGLPDTRTDALASLQSNATATVITASSSDGSNAVLVAGVWVADLESRMTATVGGRVTHLPLASERLPVTASVTIEPSSGTNVSLSAYIAVNGVVAVNSKKTASASASAPASVTIPWQIDFNENDYVEIFVENNDTTANILVSSGMLRVN